MDHNGDLTCLPDVSSPESIQIECELDPQNILALEFSNQSLQVSDESNPLSDNMGIENSWSQDDFFSTASTTSNFPIPLPPPNSSDVCEGPENFTGELGSLFETPQESDVSDSSAQQGVCGLKNLGNTCFMSAGLQSLVATSSLVEYFTCKSYEENTNHCMDSKTSSSLLHEFSLLVKKMWSGKYSIVRPSDFKQILGIYYPQFKDYRQHDCQEFLALLLDGLHEQLNTATTCDYSASQLLLCDIPIKNYECTSTSLLENNHIDVSDKDFFNLRRQICSPLKVTNELKTGSDVATPAKSTNMEIVLMNGDVSPVGLNDLAFNLKDILKDAKTSNVNVLVTQSEANNEIRFDSEKFPRKERRRDGVKVNINSLYENPSTPSGKRNKSSGELECSSMQDYTDELVDLKRIKMFDNESGKCNNSLNSFEEKNFMMEISRKKYLEKNIRMECERKNNTQVSESIDEEDDDDGAMGDASASVVDLDADKHWQAHLADNQSILVDLFQGQFKSTVVCSGCQFVSITYEPFMYLSVPLPFAMERQICITFIPSSPSPPVNLLSTVSKQDRVGHIQSSVARLVDTESDLLLAEVLDHHVAKFLEPNSLVRYINDVNRKVYAFELAPPSPIDPEDTEMEFNGSVASLKCTICLEEKETNIKKHKDCTCSLCDDCVSSYSNYNKTQFNLGPSDSFSCPVCGSNVNPEIDLINIEDCGNIKPTFRVLNVPVVFRLDVLGDGNNNKKSVELFGHPRLISVSNHISAEALHEKVKSILPSSYLSIPYKLLLVDGQGSHCSRCMFNAHCRGCLVPREGILTLHNSDTLAVTYSENLESLTTLQSEMSSTRHNSEGSKTSQSKWSWISQNLPDEMPVNHESLQALRSPKPLSLYDCIKAFSQSELLDEHNPWFCPRCKNNQCATKTLSVCRYPEYLIVYLKRFVFHECMSLKLEDKVQFPLTNLVMQHCSFVYDLYACVCHVGGVSAGHYTAYTLHPTSKEWHYFNDETVLDQRPQDEDFNNAYILFYKKRDEDADSETV